MEHNLIAASGYLRLAQIVGNHKVGIPAIIPVSKSTWWQKCKTDPRWPQPVKLGRCTLWKASDIRDLIQKLDGVE